LVARRHFAWEAGPQGLGGPTSARLIPTLNRLPFSGSRYRFGLLLGTISSTRRDGIGRHLGNRRRDYQHKTAYL